MASVRSRKGSLKWYACITLPDGRQKQFSTGLNDREEAQAIAVAAERAARKHHENPHQLRAALDRLAEDFIPVEDSNPGDWLKAWAASRDHEVSAATSALYKTTATEAAAWLELHNVRSFTALTAARVKQLRDTWAKVSNTTANKKLKHLRIALKVGVAEKLLLSNPATEVLLLQTKKTARREFRIAEIEVLLPALVGEWRSLFFLGLYTGQRLNDLAALRWSQIDLAARTITFQAQKTQKLVALPLPQTAVDALTELPSADKPDAQVFPAIWKMKQSSRSNAFRKILAGVGLASHPDVKKAFKGGSRVTAPLSFHSLRHTLTSMLKSSGVSDSIARAIVGHESAAVSRSYTHLDLETMRTALDKMPGF